jgi:hypothetical protein
MQVNTHDNKIVMLLKVYSFVSFSKNFAVNESE